jgi:hypothetical protein
LCLGGAETPDTPFFISASQIFISASVYMSKVLHSPYVSAACGLLVAKRSAAHCHIDDSHYYGKVDGGIGDRIRIHGAQLLYLPGTGIANVVNLEDTHENLRRWASETNWHAATQIHKRMYFTRTTNEEQEQILKVLRQHYISASLPTSNGGHGYQAPQPVQASLFRLVNMSEFSAPWHITLLKQIPTTTYGPIQEEKMRYVVDFANKRLGGAWLSYGMAQEEKMFMERFDYGALVAKSHQDTFPAGAASNGPAPLGLASPQSDFNEGE